MRALVLCAGALALSACATLGGSPSVAAQRGVYQAESDFAAFLPVAVAYENLPACAKGVVVPCADPSIVSKLTAAARVARASLMTAEGAVRSSNNGAALTSAALQAQSDVTAFKTLVEAFAK